MEIPFIWYLHDDRAYFNEAWFTDRHPAITPELAELMSKERPFYEVTIKCTVNSETGKVTIISAE